MFQQEDFPLARATGSPSFLLCVGVTLDLLLPSCSQQEDEATIEDSQAKSGKEPGSLMT